METAKEEAMKAKGKANRQVRADSPMVDKAEVKSLSGSVGWKIWTFVSHGSTKKGRKTKEFPRIEGTIFKMW